MHASSFFSVRRLAATHAWAARPVRWSLLGAAALLAACGSIPVSSLWKLRNLQLETLDPAALRAAVVHGPALRLQGQSLVLSVTVSRKVRKPGGTLATETLAEKLPLQELRTTAERSALQDHERPGAVVKVWRIDPAALPRLQALRATALGWKQSQGDAGQRELALGLELAGCHTGPLNQQVVSTLLRFSEPGEYIPIVQQIRLDETMPPAELQQRFPPCAPGG